MPSNTETYRSIDLDDFREEAGAGVGRCVSACEEDGRCLSAIHYYSARTCYLFEFHFQNTPYAAGTETGSLGNNIRIILKGTPVKGKTRPLKQS